MNCAPLGHKRSRGEVVARPTRQYNDLETVRFLGKQRPKPVHPAVVALNELVIEDDRRAQILRERQPIQCGQLFASALLRAYCMQEARTIPSLQLHGIFRQKPEDL
jgi:hypothetical protein